MTTFTQRRRRWALTIRHRVKTFLGARPRLFFPIFRRRSAFDDLLVHGDTDICIEGFPRSANSFAVGAFEHAQTRPVRVAHHTHTPANIMRACEHEIPALVLTRAPYDAIVSGVALKKQVQVEEHDEESPVQLLSFHDRLDAYLTFYQSLDPYRDRILVASFETVVRDMGRVVGRVNERFGTAFDRFDHTPEAAEEIHARRGYHAGPSDQRTQFKEETRADFDEQLRADAALRDKMEAATSLFDALVAGADEGDSAEVKTEA